MNATATPITQVATVKLLIDGQFVESKSGEWRDVINPATQEVLARVPFATQAEVDAAVASAKQAFKTWKKTPLGARSRVFLKLQQLIRENMGELAAILTAEQGKTLPDAEGDVFRGLEVVEHASGIGNLQLGELANNVANGVDTYSLLQPLGVCAGITPFNFPR
jgi:malonate-semialdehyde dehydrogenase (acetylating)/methylmalonate-semialdehyde dehydrogenase